MFRTHATKSCWGLAVSFGLTLGTIGCGSPEVGSIKADDGSATDAVKSKTEGRFKETIPPKPARSKKTSPDEGIESR